LRTWQFIRVGDVVEVPQDVTETCGSLYEDLEMRYGYNRWERGPRVLLPFVLHGFVASALPTCTGSMVTCRNDTPDFRFGLMPADIPSPSPTGILRVEAYWCLYYVDPESVLVKQRACGTQDSEHQGGGLRCLDPPNSASVAL
jgi:hypothetical protein